MPASVIPRIASFAKQFKDEQGERIETGRNKIFFEHIKIATKHLSS